MNRLCLVAHKIMSDNNKRTVYVGGLADEVNEQLVHDAFIPFGDLVEIQMPVDYESQKHRGFAFVEFETAEDAAAAIDNMVNFKAKRNEFQSFEQSFFVFVELLFVE